MPIVKENLLPLFLSSLFEKEKKRTRLKDLRKCVNSSSIGFWYEGSWWDFIRFNTFFLLTSCYGYKAKVITSTADNIQRNTINSEELYTLSLTATPGGDSGSKALLQTDVCTYVVIRSVVGGIIMYIATHNTLMGQYSTLIIHEEISIKIDRWEKKKLPMFIGDA